MNLIVKDVFYKRRCLDATDKKCEGNGAYKSSPLLDEVDWIDHLEFPHRDMGHALPDASEPLPIQFGQN